MWGRCKNFYPILPFPQPFHFFINLKRLKITHYSKNLYFYQLRTTFENSRIKWTQKWRNSRTYIKKLVNDKFCFRATGIAISMVAARLGGIIGNIVIATLLDLYCPAPTFIVAGLLICGGLLCLLLPNTTREPLH